MTEKQSWLNNAYKRLTIRHRAHRNAQRSPQTQRKRKESTFVVCVLAPNGIRWIGSFGSPHVCIFCMCLRNSSLLSLKQNSSYYQQSISLSLQYISSRNYETLCCTLASNGCACFRCAFAITNDLVVVGDRRKDRIGSSAIDCRYDERTGRYGEKLRKSRAKDLRVRLIVYWECNF
jgi:hypothetical protein